jgi:HAD superfamily hydrolase (TIGR01509 family)
VISTASAAGLPVAVVSNNSAAAVDAYLSMHGLSQHVSVVIGRPYGRPDLMKPNPAPILDAVHALGASPAASVLIGDSVADVEGARAAGVRVIGYANRPHKAEDLQEADAVIETMGVIHDLLVHLDRA